MAITKVINDAVDLNQTTDYSGLRLPVGTTGNVVESFTTDYLVVGGGGGTQSGGGSNYPGGGGAGGLRTSYNNSTTTTNTLSFPSGKTAIATYMLNSDATDVSGNYNGTETNITYNTGQYGGAAVFNGSNSKIDTGIASISSPFAVSMWINEDVLNSGVFFGNWNSTSADMYWQTTSDGRLRISIDGFSQQYFGTAGDVSINTWHHIAVTLSGGSYEVYLDGNSLGTSTTSVTTFSSGQNFMIGNSSKPSTPLPFDGEIDQVRIYNSALSSTDITNIYNNEVQANSGGGSAAESSLTLTAGTAYNVTVGGATTTGEDSTFSTITALGGGRSGGPAASAFGSNGGSGGGASGDAYSAAGGNGALNQGYAGGSSGPSCSGSSCRYPGGGGGGATEVGTNATTTTAGNGGDGLEVNIIGGTGNYYAGGGGGSSYLSGAATGGLGGGGNGSARLSGSEVANDGAANTGGGGGGGLIASSIPALGGSGVAILRYPAASVSSFTTTGTLNTPSTTDTIADTAYPVANSAYYKLDNSAIDLSGSTGKFDQGGVFNGSSSYIDLGASLLGSRSAFSVSAWVNFDNLNTQNFIFYNSESGTGGNLGFYDFGNGNIYFQPDASTSANRGYVSNSGIYTTSEWVHIVMVFDGSATSNSNRLKAYIQGQPITLTYDGTIPSSSGTSTANSWIGGRASTKFSGSIDQVRVYNTALSSTDVTALYNETVSTTGQLNFPSGQTAIATYELNGNANGILTTTDLSTVNYPAGAGCIALYEMNGTADDTSGVYNGTPSNIDYNFGAFGQAAVFNGTNYIVTPELGDRTTFSYSFWMNMSNASGANKYIFGEQVGGQIFANSGALQIYSNSGIRTFSGSPTVSNNTWHHIVLSVSSGTATVYVDKVNKGTSSDTSTGITAPLYMGTASTQVGVSLYAMQGLLDQVRIFNTALTQAQVTTLARGIGTSYSGADTNVSYAYNGTPTNVTYGNGRFGQAAVFNGSNSSLDIESLDLIQNKIESFSFWFKSKFIFGFYDPSSASSSDRRRWFIDNNTTGSIKIQVNNDQYNYEQTGITENSDWHHLAVVSDGKIYLDGIQLTNTFNTSYWITGGTNGSSRDTIRIGSSDYAGTASSGFYAGSIDQVRTFPSTLSAANVTDLYNEHYQTKFTDGSDTAIVFTQGTGTVTFSSAAPAPPQGALRTNTSYSEDGSGSVIEHYNGTDWKYFDAIKYCTTNTLNFPSGAGCIASYNLNNNVNDIGNTYNGVNSNVTFTASGKFGAAAVFNGSSSYVLASSFMPTGSNPRSASAWVKTTISNANMTILFSGSGSNNNAFIFRVINGKLGVAFYANDHDFTATGLTDGNWHHVVATYDGSVAKVYLDGNLIGTGSAGAVSTNSGNFAIGAYNNGVDALFNGSIDQVRIFNDSLTSDEVAQLYNNEIACS